MERSLLCLGLLSGSASPLLATVVVSIFLSFFLDWKEDGNYLGIKNRSIISMEPPYFWFQILRLHEARSRPSAAGVHGDLLELGVGYSPS